MARLILVVTCCLWGTLFTDGVENAAAQVYTLENGRLRAAIDLRFGVRVTQLRSDGKEILPPVASEFQRGGLFGDHALGFSHAHDLEWRTPLLARKFLKDLNCAKPAANELICSYRIESGHRHAGDLDGIKFIKTISLDATRARLSARVRLLNMDSVPRTFSYASLHHLNPGEDIYYPAMGRVIAVNERRTWEMPILHDADPFLASRVTPNFWLGLSPAARGFRQFFRGNDLLYLVYHPVTLGPGEMIEYSEAATFFPAQSDLSGPLGTLSDTAVWVGPSIAAAGGVAEGSYLPSFKPGDKPEFMVTLSRSWPEDEDRKLELALSLRDLSSDAVIERNERSVDFSGSQRASFLFSPTAELPEGSYALDISLAATVDQPRVSYYWQVADAPAQVPSLFKRNDLPLLEVAFVFNAHMPAGYDEDLKRHLDSYRSFLSFSKADKVPLTLQFTGGLLQRLRALQPDITHALVKGVHGERFEMMCCGVEWGILPLISRLVSRVAAQGQVEQDLVLKNRMFNPDRCRGFFPPEMAWDPAEAVLPPGFAESSGSYLLLDDAAINGLEVSRIGSEAPLFVNPVQDDADRRVVLRNARLSHYFWKSTLRRGDRFTLPAWIQLIRREHAPALLVIGTDLEQFFNYEPNISALRELVGTLRSISGIRLTTISSFLDRHPQGTGERLSLQPSSWQGGFRYWYGSSADTDQWNNAATLWNKFQSVSCPSARGEELRERFIEIFQASLDGGHFWYEGNEAYRREIEELEKLLAQLSSGSECMGNPY